MPRPGIRTAPQEKTAVYILAPLEVRRSKYILLCRGLGAFAPQFSPIFLQFHYILFCAYVVPTLWERFNKSAYIKKAPHYQAFFIARRLCIWSSP